MGPRFQGENLQHNLDHLDALRKIAEQEGSSVVQSGIAWVLSHGEDIVPLIGARTRGRLSGAPGALDVALDEAGLTGMEQAVPDGPRRASASPRRRWRTSTASADPGTPRLPGPPPHNACQIH